ncbi:MAG: hypothetical protein ACODAQ_04360 [Phycisphaeraceae bacterium]
MSETRMLRDVVEQRINRRWSAFAKAHPHLAAVIDRTRLVESAVQRLRDDPAFRAAMAEADLDEAKLVAAARVLERAEALALQVLPL